MNDRLARRLSNLIRRGYSMGKAMEIALEKWPHLFDYPLIKTGGKWKRQEK